jgi:hypothetical protein
MPQNFRPPGDYRHLKVSTLKVKPDFQQSGSGSSKAMCNKIQIAPDMTIRTIQNPREARSSYYLLNVHNTQQQDTQLKIGFCLHYLRCQWFFFLFLFYIGEL